MIVGIDLGTTNSVVACMTEDGPQLIPNALGENLTPSVVGFEPDGHLLVGSIAKEYQVLHPERCVGLFKRHMGSDWSVKIAGKKYTPEELSSLVLTWLKQDAENFLGQSVSRAVITVPAYFNDDQRKATILAGQLAGLTVERIINEPTAAAIAYGLHDMEQEKTVVVIDLGGGTFDVSVVDLFEGLVEVRASSGESFLGGEDFTRILAARVLNSHGIIYEQAEFKSPGLIARMIQQCELAKCRLTTEQSVEVRIPNEQGDFAEDAPTLTVTREEFCGWIKSLLARIELPLRRSLGDVKLNISMIDEVILVGGATRMPAVRDRVQDFFGQSPHSRLNPDEVVGLGAAVQAGLINRDACLEDIVVTDVASFTLGVDVSKQVGLEQRNGYFSPIIHRNMTIPISRTEGYQTLRANQAILKFNIYQGENRRVKDNHKLGELTVEGIPLGPAGQQVHVRMTYDLNGVLEVEATVVATGKRVSTIITQHAHGLSEEDIAEALKSMESLKLHPREDSANRFVLRRAERLYEELPFGDRDRLSGLLDGFEEVLEMQDRAAIEQFRQELEKFIQRHELNEND